MNNNSKSTLQVFDGYKPTIKNEWRQKHETIKKRHGRPLYERIVNYDRNTIRPMRALPGTTRAMP